MAKVDKGVILVKGRDLPGFVDGVPYSKLSDKFYSDITDVVKGVGLKLTIVESESTTIDIKDINKVASESIFILHSRGDKYIKELVDYKITPEQVVVIDGSANLAEDPDVGLYLAHSEDNTMNNDVSTKSIIAHLTLTPEMRKELAKHLKANK